MAELAPMLLRKSTARTAVVGPSAYAAGNVPTIAARRRNGRDRSLGMEERIIACLSDDDRDFGHCLKLIVLQNVANRGISSEIPRPAAGEATRTCSSLEGTLYGSDAPGGTRRRGRLAARSGRLAGQPVIGCAFRCPTIAGAVGAIGTGGVGIGIDIDGI